jgi:hypothetical protein
MVVMITSVPQTTSYNYEVKNGQMANLLTPSWVRIKLATKYAANRFHMVQYQLVSRGIYDGRVLKAISEVPRHLFVPELYRHAAYKDRPLPIREGQTISQPFYGSYYDAVS